MTVELVAAAGCALLTVAFLAGPVRFVLRAQRVAGVVVAIDTIETHDGPAYAPTIEYTPHDGRTRRCTPLGHSTVAPPVGSPVDVLFDPASDRAEPATFGAVWGLPLILAGTTGSACVVAVLHAVWG